jgi:hypothetical protein
MTLDVCADLFEPDLTSAAESVGGHKALKSTSVRRQKAFTSADT